MALKTDYKDDVLDTSVNTQRKYNMIQNNDGTVSFEDATEYLQIGDSFGAQEINDLVGRVLTITNLTIATSEWIDSVNGTDFPYYANVSIESATEKHVPNVNFSLVDSQSGILASVCESHDGYVTIYASKVPVSAITIPVIQLIKSV